MEIILVAVIMGVSYFVGCYLGHKLFVRKFKKQLTHLL